MNITVLVTDDLCCSCSLLWHSGEGSDDNSQHIVNIAVSTQWLRAHGHPVVTARGTVDIEEAIYTTAWTGPALGWARLGSAWAGGGLVHLHLLSGPDLSQKFHVIIAEHAS